MGSRARSMARLLGVSRVGSARNIFFRDVSSRVLSSSRLTTTTVSTANITSTATITSNIVSSVEVTSTSITSNNIVASGNVVFNNLKFPTSDGSADQFIKTDGSGNLSFGTVDLDGYLQVANSTNLASTGKSIAMSIVFGG